MTKIIRTFFYGNIYLGICAVVLCIETNLLYHISLNVFTFYLLIFLSTIIYYTMIYVRSVRARNYNDRTIWYITNLVSIKLTLKIGIALTGAFLIFLLVRNLQQLLLLSPLHLLLMIAFPLAAAWYTFNPSIFRIGKIRQVGWIKPFIVGLTWTGWVTVYPVLLWQVQRKQPVFFERVPMILLCLQNFLFFSINAIIFDIRDYRTDTLKRLNTYPVMFGVRNTFRYIISPLLLLNLLVFFLFQSLQKFSILQTLIQIIPYLLLAFVIISHRQGRKVLFYLAAVDGLVFLKALCGITSILLIKK